MAKKSKPKKKGAVEVKLERFIINLEAVENGKRVWGLSIPSIADYLEWVLRFKPEYRALANLIADKVVYMMDKGLLDNPDYWDRI